jgi:hypothetical protein
MRGIVVALVVAGLRVSGTRRNGASREIEKGGGQNELHCCPCFFSAQVQMEAIA